MTQMTMARIGLSFPPISHEATKAQNQTAGREAAIALRSHPAGRGGGGGDAAAVVETAFRVKSPNEFASNRLTNPRQIA